MNILKVKINVDKTAAIVAGSGEFGPKIINIDPAEVPVELRAELATCYSDSAADSDALYVSKNPISTYYSNSPKHPAFPYANLKTLIDVLRWRVAVRRYKYEKDAAEKEQIVLNVLSRPSADWVRYTDLKRYSNGIKYVNFPETIEIPGESRSFVTEDPRIIARKAQVEAEIDIKSLQTEWKIAKNAQENKELREKIATLEAEIIALEIDKQQLVKKIDRLKTEIYVVEQ